MTRGYFRLVRYGNNFWNWEVDWGIGCGVKKEKTPQKDTFTPS